MRELTAILTTEPGWHRVPDLARRWYPNHLSMDIEHECVPRCAQQAHA